MTYSLLPLLIAFFVTMAALSFVFRAWPRVVGLTGAALAAATGLWLWSLDFSRPFWLFPNGVILDLTAPITRFGYTFRLQEANAPIVAMNLAIAAAALLLAARTTADRTFSAMTWLLLTGYSLLALIVAGPIAPALASPILLVMLTALGAFAVQGNRRVNPAGSLRMLIPPILAAPVFFIAAWYVDQIPLNPQDASLPQITGGLLGLGLLLLLMPFPLHTGWPATASTAAPPATLLVFMLSQLAVLHLAGQILTTYPFLLTETDWAILLALFGLLTAVWGGVAAIGATTAGQLWGYAALYDWGLIILVLATPGVQSWTLVLFLFGLRAISMFTAATGLETLEQHLGRLDFASLRGVGSHMPWNSAAFLLGGLGLLGFPLSAGFAGHWSALQQVAALDWRPAAVVLVASGVAVIGFVRIARDMFGQQSGLTIPRERVASITVAILALAITITAGIAPQLLNDYVGRALAAFGRGV